MPYPRHYDNLMHWLKHHKVLVIYGTRQVGKTTLLTHFLAKTTLRYKLDNGDDIRVQQLLSVPDAHALKDYVEGYELLVIDEAQNIANIGQSLKILIDQVPDLLIIVTGSSSFELAGQMGEPLTGRKTTITLYPLAQLELYKLYNRHELSEQLANMLVYGSYPEVLNAKTLTNKRETLIELANSYLLKDILMLDRIKNAKKLFDLLKLLAFQIGGEVSHSELGRQLSMDNKTVARYLDLLEKAFIIVELNGFSRNLRKEITKKSKYYFYDTGMRNAIIANFNPLDLRNDIGQLWENFCIIERLKKQAYCKIYANNYFWRTWDGKEIDLIEERGGSLYAYEFKWGQHKKITAPKDWLQNYPEAKFKVINQDNYLDFVLEDPTKVS